MLLAALAAFSAQAIETANPSIEISVGFTKHAGGDAVDRACQGTVIARHKVTAGWMCTMLTATHCVLDEDADQKATFISTRQLGLSRLLSVEMKSKDTRSAADDIAVVQFADGCDRAEGLVVPLHGSHVTVAGKDGLPTQVFVASRTYDRALTGVLRERFTGPSAETPIEAIIARDPIPQTSNPALYQGDSGGGIFVRSAQTQTLELVGVLSAIWMRGVKRAEVRKHQPLNKGSVEAIGSRDLAWVMRQTGADTHEAFSPAAASPSGDKSIQLLETFLK